MTMPERIMSCVETVNNNPEFLDMAKDRLTNIIEYANIPMRYLLNGIDVNNSSHRLKTELNKFMSYIDDSESYLIRTDSFAFSGYIAAYIFEQYVYDKLCADEHIKSILIVDTNLLLEDFKKLITISQNNDLKPRLNYDLDFIYNKLLDADFIFWDKFNYNKTDYTLSKLYEILSTRYLNCAGNCFFVSGPSVKEIMKGIDGEFINVMNCITHTFEFQNENYSLRK